MTFLLIAILIGVIFCGWQLRGIRINQVLQSKAHTTQRSEMLNAIKRELRVMNHG